MNSKQIQENIYQYCLTRGFDAPYGVLTGEHTNTKGRKYLSVTFGRSRTLDCTVEIYNRNFILLKASNRYNKVYNDYNTLMQDLATL